MSGFDQGYQAEEVGKPNLPFDVEPGARGITMRGTGPEREVGDQNRQMPPPNLAREHVDVTDIPQSGSRSRG